MNFKKVFLISILMTGFFTLIFSSILSADELWDNNFVAQNHLNNMVAGSEKFAKDHGGKYPVSIEDLTQGEIVYLTNNVCGKEAKGFNFICSCNADGKGCLFKAIPVVSGKTGSEIQKSVGILKPGDVIEKAPPVNNSQIENEPPANPQTEIPAAETKNPMPEKSEPAPAENVSEKQTEPAVNASEDIQDTEESSANDNDHANVNEAVPSGTLNAEHEENKGSLLGH